MEQTLKDQLKEARKASHALNRVSEEQIDRVLMNLADAVEKHMETMVYLASDIQKALGLGRSKTYLFLDEVYRQQENPPFRVIKVGKLFRVPKKSFDDWINAAQ